MSTSPISDLSPRYLWRSPSVSPSNRTADSRSGGGAGQSTPGLTLFSSATTAAASTSAVSASTSNSSNTNLDQDLRAFLHDLFHALNQTRASHGGHVASGTPTTPSTVESDDAPSVAASAAAASAAAASPVATTTAASSSTPSTGSTTAASSASAGAVASSYGQQDIISALKALVTELGNSQEITATDSSSSLSSSTLATLNTAFQKLIGDLGGDASSGTASSSTAALQSFLSGFLGDLQTGSTNSSGTLGSLLNTTA